MGHPDLVGHEDEDFRSRPLLTSCVTLDWSLNFSEPFLLHLKNYGIICTL